MTSEPNFFDVRVASIAFEAEGIHSFELRRPDGSSLPAFTAGSHIELHLANGMQRSYSLINSPGENKRYVIAISRDAKSRGGSRYIHDHLRVGQMVRISRPRNNFELSEDAAPSILISGGIGITPMLCMIERLEQLQRQWHLYLCARSREHAAFLDTLVERFGEKARLSIHLDDEAGQVADLAGIVAAAPENAHLYCCGPAPMLDAFLAAAASRAKDHVHVEYFTAKEAPAVEGGFKVVLGKSNREFSIAPGQTILQTILDMGIDVSYSCMEGICGACETKVLEGEPDHRDVVLTEEERRTNKTMMICCSGCKTERLVLDL
jgi:vanillate O-demethylase ferredoxin subunit